MQLTFKYHFSRRQRYFCRCVFFQNQIATEINKIICVRLFTIYIVSMINRNLFMDGYCRNIYDELTSNENANQYEVVLKKGSANWY